MESSQSLPAYAGYAIGNLIRKELVHLYTWKQERDVLRREIEELEAKKPKETEEQKLSQ
ncbi:MAG: hypothetical protein H0T62_08925, partial [Parachlamydiaceae bacterium]|nr:hypothetical protein [Parachlamydiaceae bacterium]